jgi:deoxycytidylate deaminase
MNKVKLGKQVAFDAAVQQIECNPNDRAHLGAVLTRGKQVVWGTNIMGKTHPDSQVWKDGVQIVKGVHAEQMTLIKGRKFTDGGILYVARVTKAKNLALASPCSVCRYLIKESNIKRVHYSVGPNEWGEWNV